jgi:hypothetical protein
LSITDLAEQYRRASALVRRRRTLRDRLARESRERLEAEGQLSFDLPPAPGGAP